MLIIIDDKMPFAAKEKLREYGILLELTTTGITYAAISGHPDIFFCPFTAGIVVAPNLPEKYFSILRQHQTKFLTGEMSVRTTYPQTAHYNAVITRKHLIHNLNYTDAALLKASEGLKKIHVNQGYTCCNLLAMNEDVFITSDKGIYKTLLAHGLCCHYFPPDEIQLDGFPHGFLGGACGIWGQKLFICGSLKYHSWGNDLKEIAESAGYGVVELVDSCLQDHGSLFFI